MNKEAYFNDILVDCAHCAVGAGWLCGRAADEYQPEPDLVGGAVGSLAAGLIGIGSTNMLGGTLISVAGACLVIYLARLLLPRIKR